MIYHTRRRDQQLAIAQRKLTEAMGAIHAAMTLNDRLPRMEQVGGMELAQASDEASGAIRRITEAKQRNGYGQPAVRS